MQICVYFFAETVIIKDEEEPISASQRSGSASPTDLSPSTTDLSPTKTDKIDDVQETDDEILLVGG